MRIVFLHIYFDPPGHEGQMFGKYLPSYQQPKFKYHYSRRKGPWMKTQGTVFPYENNDNVDNVGNLISLHGNNVMGIVHTKKQICTMFT